MAKYTSYLWRELSSDNCWRIQTTDPNIKSKLRRRNSAMLVGECINHPMVIYKLQYYSPQKAKQSFERLTGQKIKKDLVEDVFYPETYPILTNKNVPEVQS
tara:strand:+ start:130 stop:432 length:303 start_codon:yes stop_codon:yes gene_type:complete